jgi:hypothetical protein
VTQSIGDGAKLTGVVPWNVTVAGQPVSKVEFRIDGSLRWTETTAPWVFNGDGRTLDSTGLANGQHLLTATAYSESGASASTSATVAVDNPARAGAVATPSRTPNAAAPVVATPTAAAPLELAPYAVEWDGRLFRTMGSFRTYLTRQGVNWQGFLLRHPLLAERNALPVVVWNGRKFYDQPSLVEYLGGKASYARWAQRHPDAAAILAGRPVAGITRQPAQISQKRPLLVWAGIDFTSASGLRSYVEGQGKDWNRFLVEHPAAARRLSLTSVTWQGASFYTRSALSRWLAERRVALARWTKAHPGVVEKLMP